MPKQQSIDQGFTLIEILVGIIIIGIGAALATPSFLGLVERNRIKDAQVQLKGSLQEAQREAIKRGQNCRVFLPAADTANSKGEITIADNNGDTDDDDGEGCLVTGSRVMDGVLMSYAPTKNTDTNSFQFNFKGETGNNLDSGEMIFVIYTKNGDQINAYDQKCIVVSNPLGLIKTGNYEGYTNVASIAQDNCTPN
ncbi:MAG: prepilin-type N-terminal cleavage/methylation domain-containing protein [Synechococcaceae cyanobacterium RL_1_2]|nr:prepilin-type N-terminal cleavage/methylation domain-containing protein [Synechococcaceae cyanobacterium RL_1_2]